MVIGRIFNKKLLDMVDFEVTNFEEIDQGRSWNKILVNNYPVMAFQGAGFEFDNENKRIRNLLHDLFCRGTELKEGDLLGLTRLFISVTLENNLLSLRFYISQITSSIMEKNSWTSEPILEEIGPRVDMQIRRKEVAADDDYKQAISRKGYLTQKAVS